MPSGDGGAAGRIGREFAHLGSAYLNTAYMGPSPLSAGEAVRAAMDREADPALHEFREWLAIPERVRGAIAGLLGASPDGVCHATSTGDVVSVAAQGLPLGPGDAVCAVDGDYPSNVLPWMRAAETRGVEFHLLRPGPRDARPPDPEWLAANLPPNAKALSVSHVAFDTGARTDVLGVGRLLRERGVLFVLDATQSFGGVPLFREELDAVDVLACSCYKWLLGPYGYAFGRFSDRACSTIRHTHANWTTAPGFDRLESLLDYTTETLAGARKFDRGQGANMLAMACLEAGVRLLAQVGLDAVQKRNAALRDLFLENYPKKKYELVTPRDRMANIVCVKAKGGVDADALSRTLRDRGVEVSVRQGNVRLSFHFFNTEEHVRRLIEALDA